MRERPASLRAGGALLRGQCLPVLPFDGPEVTAADAAHQGCPLAG